MKVSLLGAAGGDVTGSAYLVQSERARVLVDFGLFQGAALAEDRNRIPRALQVRQLDAVLLTHAHLDHTGRLPLLARAGYHRYIHATEATIELTGLILRDAAHIQEGDAERINRKRLRAGQEPIEPLFRFEDVERLMPLWRSVDYDRPTEVAPGVMARWVEAGHMLGSAAIELTVDENGRRSVLVFSGDLGPRGAPILRDPAALDHAQLVFLEATYGDRDHRPLADTLVEARRIILQAVARKGRILVPTFAVGRAQQILYHLAALFREGAVPPFPVFLDSPMAAEASAIYARHAELYDEEAADLARRNSLEHDLRTLRICTTTEQSRAINDVPGPLLVMAGAGMCNAGRILHHLKHGLWRPETDVLFVGYQAPGSLGRALIDGKQTVSIFGERIRVEARIHTLGGFSSHAGQSDLIRWLGHLAPARPRVILTHGEDRGRKPLARLIREKFGIDAELSQRDQVVEA